MTMETKIANMEKQNLTLQSQIAQTGNIKLSLEKVQQEIANLKMENKTLKTQNLEITTRLKNLTMEISGGNASSLNISSMISSEFTSVEYKSLRAENKRLKLELASLDSSRNLDLNISTDISIQKSGNKQMIRDRRAARINTLITKTKESRVHVQKFMDDRDTEHNITVDIDSDDRAVMPDYDSEDSDPSYNRPSETYLVSTHTTTTTR